MSAEVEYPWIHGAPRCDERVRPNGLAYALVGLVAVQISAAVYALYRPVWAGETRPLWFHATLATVTAWLPFAIYMQVQHVNSCDGWNGFVKVYVCTEVAKHAILLALHFAHTEEAQNE